MQSIFSTAPDASLRSDLTLLAYIFILLPLMLVGFAYARRKMYMPHHKYVMTGITLLNWVLIILVMVVSYGVNVAPYYVNGTSDQTHLLATVHLIPGLIAQILATYLVILMWTEKTRFEKVLPYRVRKIKPYMRATLALWLITVVLGIITYVVWYEPGKAAVGNAPAPAATEDAAPAATEESAIPVATEDAAPVATEELAAPAATEESAAPDTPATTEEAGA